MGLAGGDQVRVTVELVTARAWILARPAGLALSVTAMTPELAVQPALVQASVFSSYVV